ncbi:hypothetical protein [Azospirillum soli]|uniref:hypothetical protein n=1 Tax=Azospirillum soli TaxID=1304799 RepID=UPI001AE26368|nr:hypothetical protein [Azospirillum soli]MBP2315671.1 uncharacterized protein YneF (UPF0154 family) [Azospirillum soli]
MGKGTQCWHLTPEETVWACYGAVVGFVAGSYIGALACGYAMATTCRQTNENMHKKNMNGIMPCTYKFMVMPFSIYIIIGSAGVFHGYSWTIACREFSSPCMVQNPFFNLFTPGQLASQFDAIRLQFFTHNRQFHSAMEANSVLSIERFYIFTLFFCPLSSIVFGILHWKSGAIYISEVAIMAAKKEKSKYGYNVDSMIIDANKKTIFNTLLKLMISCLFIIIFFAWSAHHTMYEYIENPPDISRKAKSTMQSMRFDPFAIGLIYITIFMPCISLSLLTAFTTTMCVNVKKMREDIEENPKL